MELNEFYISKWPRAYHQEAIPQQRHLHVFLWLLPFQFIVYCMPISAAIALVIHWSFYFAIAINTF